MSSWHVSRNLNPCTSVLFIFCSSIVTTDWTFRDNSTTHTHLAYLTQHVVKSRILSEASIVSSVCIYKWLLVHYHKLDCCPFLSSPVHITRHIIYIIARLSPNYVVAYETCSHRNWTNRNKFFLCKIWGDHCGEVHFADFWLVTLCSDVVTMEAARFSETLASYHIATRVRARKTTTWNLYFLFIFECPIPS
jgi:hypothetical protein